MSSGWSSGLFQLTANYKFLKMFYLAEEVAKWGMNISHVCTVLFMASTYDIFPDFGVWEELEWYRCQTECNLPQRPCWQPAGASDDSQSASYVHLR